MTEMMPVHQHISDTVRAHRLVAYASTRDIEHKYKCACGWVSPEPYCTWTDHPEHVSEAIVQAIRLREGYDPSRDCLVIQYRSVNSATEAADAIDVLAQRNADVITADELFKVADQLRKL